MLPNFKLSSAGNCALPEMYVAVLVRKPQGSCEETEHSTRERAGTASRSRPKRASHAAWSLRTSTEFAAPAPAW